MFVMGNEIEFGEVGKSLIETVARSANNLADSMERRPPRFNLMVAYFDGGRSNSALRAFHCRPFLRRYRPAPHPRLP